MSCDTDVSISIRSEDKAALEAAIKWQIEKEKLWAKCKDKHGGIKEKEAKKALKDHGLTEMSQLVTWGMDFDKKTKPRKARGEDYYQVKTDMWANENGRNQHITGEDGELSLFLKANPDVWIEGEWSSEYDMEGTIEARWCVKKKKFISPCGTYHGDLGGGGEW